MIVEVTPSDSGRLDRLCEVLRSRASDSRDHVEQREIFTAAMAQLPLEDPVAVRPEAAGGVACEWLTPECVVGERTLVYLHGGGYIMGSAATARRLAARLGTATCARVLSVDYRLAPEHPHPAAVEDATAAYEWLLLGCRDPEDIVVAGDSAGGGLTVATLLAARDRGLPMPAAAVCLSPWTDLTLTGASIDANDGRDPQVNRWRLEQMAELYLDGQDPRTPLASPAFADLTGLPPLLVHAGSAEALADDARALAVAAERSGVRVRVEVHDRMIHVWHYFFPGLPEAVAGIEGVTDWLENHWRTPSASVKRR